MYRMISFRIGCSTHHLEDKDLMTVADWIATTGKYVFVVKEVGTAEGHHIHSVSTFGKTPSTFRQQFVAEFPQHKGSRGLYSVKPEKIEYCEEWLVQEKNFSGNDEIDKTLRYLCKGKSKGVLPQVFKNSLISEDDVEGYHQAYWRIRENYIGESGPAKKALKETKKALTFVQSIAEKLITSRDDWEALALGHHAKKIVFAAVMDGLGVKGKALDALVVRRLCYGVFNIVSPKAMKEHLWSEVFPTDYRYDV